MRPGARCLSPAREGWWVAGRETEAHTAHGTDLSMSFFLASGLLCFMLLI